MFIVQHGIQTKLEQEVLTPYLDLDTFIIAITLVCLVTQRP